MVSRSLFSIMIALALLLAPAALQVGSANAALPADHHAQMMESGHCGPQPSKTVDGKAAGKTCCVAMCTAVAAAPASPAELPIFHASALMPSGEQFNHSFLAELPTPPPRGA